MFIRIKKIKGNNYAYVVRNKWTKNGPRQVSKKYLGKTIELNQINDDRYTDSELITDNPKKLTLQNLFRTELSNLGFHQTGKKTMQKDDITASLSTFTIKKDGREIVIKNHEGFMCSYLFKKLLNYLPKRKDPQEDSKRFAELVVYSGLKLEKEVFVELFKKFYNE